MGIRSSLKKVVPIKTIEFFKSIYSVFSSQLLKQDINSLRKKQSKLVKTIKLLDKINVIFLVIHDSVWKYEEVYNLLDKDPKFNVKIVVIPLVRKDIGQMDTYYQTFNYFKNNNYDVLGAYNEQQKSWIDVKAITKPHLVFFTNPHKLTFDKYYIENFRDALTCYVPYNFVVMSILEMQYNQVFHHSLWRLFLETEFHKGYSEKFRISKNKNTIVTGFPGLDSVFNDKFIPENPWENKNPNILKIIWAPHHTIEGQGSGLDYSSFNNYYDFFIKYLEKNPNIHIAFKPHPLLREKLYLDKKWGTNKTDKYYNKWNSITNGQLEEGNYINLFFHSDAMILDSGSFIAEYLYFDKPIQFTKKDERILERFNSFGQEVFNHLYQAKDEAEVKNFISEVVIKGNDALKVSRNKFLNEVVLPKNGKIASENIYTELINELC